MRVSLSLRGDYAVRAMLALAQHELSEEEPARASTGPVDRLSARSIADQMRIPVRFVAHVLGDLVRASLVVGSAGRRGGYRLARPAPMINLLQIVDAAEERGGAPRCVLRGIPCDPDGTCAVHDAFNGATAALRVELARTSLAELVSARR